MASEAAEELVARFLCTDQAYLIYLESGERLDVARCRNYVPDPTDPADYHNFLWVEALQGHYLLRQRVRDGVTGEWEVRRRVFPDPDSGRAFWENAEIELWVREWGLL